MCSQDASSSGKVLVIDDNPVALSITRGRLEQAGFEVTTRQEPFGSIYEIIAVSPDVVLLDVNMPGLSGETLAKMLRDNPRTSGVRIILHSSMDAALLSEMATKLGVLGALCKTDDDAMFITRFKRLFRRTR